MLVIDESGTIAEANLAAAALLSHDRARLIGKPLAALIALDDRRTFRSALTSALGGAASQHDLRLLGRPEPWRIALRPLPRVRPRSIVVSLVGGDRMPPPPPASPRGGLEQLALRFPFAVVAVQRDLRVVFANGRARRLLGHEAVRAGTIFGDAGATELRIVARRLVEVGAPLPSTIVELADGRTLRVSGLAATLDEPAALFVEDATEQRRHDNVMREFLRNAAHQLRTPLTGITAAIETLQSGAKERPADRDRFLEHVQTHAERLSRIARGLLTLARAETGEAVAVDFVELRPLVDSIVRSVEPRTGVTVHADCPVGLAAIATPDLLQEAIEALVDNAIAHTHEGEIRIRAVRQNGDVAVVVSDSGAGILPEFQDRIFEPFFRIGSTGEGYGLGLAIAAQAVRAMRGEIGVSSAVGKGTTFTVKLPSATVVR